ncbi:MAG: pilus assembly protein TadE [Actinomycetales bacterium]|nr:MAG: pilus assembly protein TadE [Actinomycetales bacterium]
MVESRLERGSAVAEFVMVASLVLLLGMGLFQLGLILHVRNTVIACAAEGARAGARADASPAEAAERTRQLVTDSLGTAYAQRVTAERATTDAGVAVVEVRVDTPIPVIGLIGPSGSMQLVGRAFDERQVSAP